MLSLNRPVGVQVCRRQPAARNRSLVITRSGSTSGPSSSDQPKSSADTYRDYIQKHRDFARELRASGNLLISDVVSKSEDGTQLQWVDIVLAGGGLLGIAHVGFVCVLEEAGVRFRGIGGTSAGAINAIIIAATRDDSSEESWVKTLQILQNAPFKDFQDGENVENINQLIKDGLGRNGAAPATGPMATVGKWTSLIWRLGTALTWEAAGVWKRRGLHPGNKFRDWVKGHLNENGVSTVADLKKKMSLEGLGLHVRSDRIVVGPPSNSGAPSLEDRPEYIDKAELKLVASDIVTQTKVVFPDMADLYFKDPSSQDPSMFVRASMSVPGFFQPFEISDIPEDAQSVKNAWAATDYPADQIPKKATLVDGGTLSNFPISLFDRPGVPLLPTIGCELGVQRGKPQDASNPFLLYKAMNNTSRHIGDYDFIIKNPIYKKLVATADTHGFGWLDFDMPEEKKLELFKKGADAGHKLLNTFQLSDTNPKGKDNWTMIKVARARASEGQGNGAK